MDQRQLWVFFIDMIIFFRLQNFWVSTYSSRISSFGSWINAHANEIRLFSPSLHIAINLSSPGSSNRAARNSVFFLILSLSMPYKSPKKLSISRVVNFWSIDTSCGIYPINWCLQLWTSPNSSIVPCCKLSIPIIHLIKVVFPTPEAPIKV